MHVSNCQQKCPSYTLPTHHRSTSAALSPSIQSTSSVAGELIQVKTYITQCFSHLFCVVNKARPFIFFTLHTKFHTTAQFITGVHKYSRYLTATSKFWVMTVSKFYSEGPY